MYQPLLPPRRRTYELRLIVAEQLQKISLSHPQPGHHSRISTIIPRSMQQAPVSTRQQLRHHKDSTSRFPRSLLNTFIPAIV